MSGAILRIPCPGVPLSQRPEHRDAKILLQGHGAGHQMG